MFSHVQCEIFQIAQSASWLDSEVDWKLLKKLGINTVIFPSSFLASVGVFKLYEIVRGDYLKLIHLSPHLGRQNYRAYGFEISDHKFSILPIKKNQYQ